MENQVPAWSGQILVIGAGCSGIGAAIKLREAGFSDFVLLEKAKSVGGTWRENTYPGCACDVPSALYSFSFAPNSEWTQAFAQQPEIQRYLEKTAEDFGVLPFVRFETAVLNARWHARTERWHVETNRGLYVAKVLVAAAGPLHEPKVPELPGLDTFEGKTFHSANWDHDYDLTGKSVAVIGTGSSAIQFVPKIQPKLGKLHLFQRTAPWVLPKPDHYVPEIERSLFRNFPWAQRALRAAEFEALEVFSYGFRHPRAMRHVERIGTWHLRRSVKNPELREKLTPHFTLGCKRILLSNTYYKALSQPNAEVHHTEVMRIEKNAVIGADGLARKVDTIIFGTGFNVTDPPIAQRIHRDDGVSLGSLWKGSPEAYNGTVVSGFPNLFFLLGPNLGTGHSSAMTIIEAQLDLLVRTMIEMRRENWSSLDVRGEAQAKYNAEVQAALQTTVYNAGGCQSYYLDKNGRNSTTWPWSTRVLHDRVRAFDARNFVISRLPILSAKKTGEVVVITGAARGIGLATAHAFAKKGARVVLGDIDAPAVREAARSVGHGAIALHVDVASRKSFDAFIAAAERDVGPVSVLVNNAGMMPVQTFAHETESVSRTTLSVNVGGVLNGMRAVAPGMSQRRSGHIVNVASMAGKMGLPGLSVYCASKYAVVGLSASVREELRAYGVSVTTILPSAVDTALVSGIKTGGGLPMVSPERIADAIVASCTHRRAEVPVPEWMRIYEPIAALVPEAVMSRIKLALGSDRLLDDASVNEEARASYDAMISAQAN